MYRETVNFEHLQEPEPDFEEDEQMPIYMDDDDVVPESQEEDMAVVQKRIEERRIRQLAIRRQIQEARRRRAERALEHAQLNAEKIKEEGTPHQKTITARSDGWYRGCIEAEYNRVSRVFRAKVGENYDCPWPRTRVNLISSFLRNRFSWNSNFVQPKNWMESILKRIMSTHMKNGKNGRKKKLWRKASLRMSHRLRWKTLSVHETRCEISTAS